MLNKMTPAIQRLFLSDCTAIGVSIVALWSMIAFVASAVSTVVEDHLLHTLLLTSAVLISLFATSALVAVIIHIRKNRNTIYLEDILASREHQETV